MATFQVVNPLPKQESLLSIKGSTVAKVYGAAECPEDAVQTVHLNGQHLQLHRNVKDQSREAHLQQGYCRKAKYEFESHRSDKKIKNKFYCAKDTQIS